MGDITFGGLATGLDTKTIITELLKLERRPLDRLEKNKSFYNSQLSAFQTLDTKMKSLQSAANALDTSKEIRSFSLSSASEDYFSATATSSAVAGSFQIEVQQLARLQKNISVAGFASKTEANFGTGTITITIGGTPTDIGYDGDSLDDIRSAINAADIDVTASIINDGSANGNRLVLTGADAATSFTVGVNETVAGSYSLAGAFTQSQSAQLAKIAIDSDTTDGNTANDILVTSTSNTITDAIPGISLSLKKVNTAGENIKLTVATDTASLQTKLASFVSSYNDILNFVKDQKDADWGSASELRSIKSRIQGLLVTRVNTTGNIDHLSELGISSDRKTGLLSLNSSTLADAVTDDLDSVVKLLAGETGFSGIMTQYDNFLDDATDTFNGMYATRQTSTTDILASIDTQITRMEERLKQKEKYLRAQFDALEQMASTMNSQGSYLSKLLS